MRGEAVYAGMLEAWTTSRSPADKPVSREAKNRICIRRRQPEGEFEAFGASILNQQHN